MSWLIRNRIRSEFSQNPWFPLLLRKPESFSTMERSEFAAVFLNKWDEEGIHHYKPEHFYPAKSGEILNGTFRLITKLGFGTTSTIWLARDIRRWWWQSKHVALKLSVNDLSPEFTDRELALASQIAKANPLHLGRQFVRTPNDAFTIQGPNGKHSVIVYEPMRESLSVLRDRMIGRRFAPDLVKTILVFLLSGLDYLHNECHVVHGDLNTENVLVPIESSRILNRFVYEGIFATPKVCRPNNRVVSLSRQDIGELEPHSPMGPPKIIDFGASFALSGGVQTHAKQSQLVRCNAPEHLLGIPLGYSADIWNLGVLTWDLLEGHGLLEVRDPVGGMRTEIMQLAEIIGLLGPPPESLRSCGSRSHLFFGPEGRFKFPELVPRPPKLKKRITSLKGENRSLFLDFLRGMLVWDPAKRKSVQELLKHRWLVQEPE